MMLEKALRSKIIKHLRTRYGGLWFVVHGGPFQSAGISDILGCWRGRFVAFEVKRPGTTRHAVTARQNAFLDSVLAAGGHAAVVRSVEEVEKIMTMIEEQHGKEPMRLVTNLGLKRIIEKAFKA